MDRIPPSSPTIDLPEGYRFERHGVLGSTNDEAFARARAGDPGKLWVLADEQSQGRGRQGRAWTSRPGNFYGTLLLRAPCAPALSPQLGFVAGVALHEAMSRLTGLDRTGQNRGRLALKWPNDLLLDGAKLAGILVEGTNLPEAGGLAVVVGIGVNLAHHPQDTPYPATDCAQAGFVISPLALLSTLSRTFADALSRWNAGQGFPGLRQDWLARAGGVGETIVVRRHDGERRGLFRDLDADGRLLLDTDGAITVIQAGDVFLPGMLARPMHENTVENESSQTPEPHRSEQRTN